MDTEIEDVKQEIRNVEQQIRNVEQQIEHVEGHLSTAVKDADVAYWRKEKDRLGKKEDRLREEKDRLRKKEDRLREEKLVLLKTSTLTSGGLGFTWVCHMNLADLAGGKKMAVSESVRFHSISPVLPYTESNLHGLCDEKISYVKSEMSILQTVAGLFRTSRQEEPRGASTHHVRQAVMTIVEFLHFLSLNAQCKIQ